MAATILATLTLCTLAFIGWMVAGMGHGARVGLGMAGAALLFAAFRGVAGF